MQTRKYPRTLNEAFGPYAHYGQIVEPSKPMDWQDVVVVVGSVLTAVAVLVFVLRGWL
jgi:hypothetical protein